MSILEIEEYISKGQYGKALDNAYKLKIKDKNSRNLLIGKVLVLQERFIEANELLEPIFNENQSDETKYEAGVLLMLSYSETDNSEQLIQIMNFIDLDLINYFENRSSKDLFIDGLYYQVKAKLAITKQKLNEANTYLELSNSCFNQIDCNTHLKNNCLIESLICIMEGDYEEAIELLENSIEDIRFTNSTKITILYNNLGGIYQTKGWLLVALDYYTTALDYANQFGQAKIKSMILNNIGNIFLNQGNYVEAISMYKESLQIKIMNNYFASTWASYHNLGKCYFLKGDVLNALKHYQKAIQVQDQCKNHLELSNTYLELVIVYLSLHDDNAAKFYHLELFRLKDINPNIVIDLYYRYSKALIFYNYNKGRMLDLAINELKLIANENIINHEVTISAMIHLCHYYVKKLQLEETKDFTSLIEYINYLEQTAKENGMQTLLSEIYQIKAKLAFNLKDESKGEKYFNQAYLLSSESGATMLADNMETLKFEVVENNHLIELVIDDLSKLMKIYA